MLTRLKPAKTGLQFVQMVKQRLQIGADQVVQADDLDRGFRPVSHFAQAQGTGQAGAALEGVQRAQQLTTRITVVRVADPAAQRGSHLRQQLLGFFLEDGKQIGIDDVGGIDVVPQCTQRRRRIPGRERWGPLDHRSRGHRLGKVQPGRRHGLVGRRRGNAIPWRHWLQRLHRRQDVRIRCLQHPGGKLMEYTPNVLGSGVEHLRLFTRAMRLALQALQGMFHRSCQLRQGGKADRGRTARQRMRPRHGGFRHGLVQLQRPFRQLSGQLARPLVGFVQVDVVKRGADTQITDLTIQLRIRRGDRAVAQRSADSRRLLSAQRVQLGQTQVQPLHVLRRNRIRRRRGVDRQGWRQCRLGHRRLCSRRGSVVRLRRLHDLDRTEPGRIQGFRQGTQFIRAQVDHLDRQRRTGFIDGPRIGFEHVQRRRGDSDIRRGDDREIGRRVRTRRQREIGQLKRFDRRQAQRRVAIRWRKRRLIGHRGLDRGHVRRHLVGGGIGQRLRPATERDALTVQPPGVGGQTERCA